MKPVWVIVETKTDIIDDRSGKNERLLLHVCDLAHYAVLASSLVSLIHERMQEGCLAGTDGPNHDHEVSGL